MDPRNPTNGQTADAATEWQAEQSAALKANQRFYDAWWERRAKEHYGAAASPTAEGGKGKRPSRTVSHPASDALRNPPTAEGGKADRPSRQVARPVRSEAAGRQREDMIKGEALRAEQAAAETGKLLSTWPARILIVSLALIALGTFAAQALEQLAELDRRIELAGRV